MKYKFPVFILVASVLFYLDSVHEWLQWLTSTVGSALIILCASWLIGCWLARTLIHRRLPPIEPKNKAVLVTGCDSGFGHLFAHSLNAYGFQVFAGCLQPDGPGARSLIKEAKHPELISVLPMDVCDDSSVDGALMAVQAHLGRHSQQLWAIVNNAGVARCGEAEWGDLDHEYRKTFDVNVLGLVRVTRKFLPLIRQCRGRIINMASLAGRLTFPLFTSYSMSKHAVISFSDGLRREVDKFGIRVITVEPFIYKTPMIVRDLTAGLEHSWQSTGSEIKVDYGQRYFDALRWYVSAFVGYYNPLMVRGNVDEVADTVLEAITLTNPEHSYVNCHPLLKPSFSIFIYLIPYELFEFYMKYYTFVMKYMQLFFKP